jgi:hypothetical protein
MEWHGLGNCLLAFINRKKEIMKKIFSFLSIAVILVVFITACNSNTKAEADSLAKLRAYQDSVKLAADTAGLAQFQAWKAQNELTEEEMYGCGIKVLCTSSYQIFFSFKKLWFQEFFFRKYRKCPGKKERMEQGG